MKSLFLLAFPRSMSSFTAQQCHKSLKGALDFPEEKSGEVLLKRYGLPPDTQHNKNYEEDYEAHKQILDKFKDSFIVKDVNQPFMATKYIKENPDVFNVVFIERNMADNIYCMFNNGWFWPVKALRGINPSVEEFLFELSIRSEYSGIGRDFKPSDWHINVALPMLIEACLYIDATCYKDIEHRLDYDKLKANPNHLFTKLSELGYNPKRFNYIDKSFQQKRKEVIGYRNKPLWNYINGYLRAILNDAQDPR